MDSSRRRKSSGGFAQFPFSFWKPSGPPPFDPSTLSLDWWQTPDYPGTGIAWPGTASAGTSGSHSDGSGSASAGSAINGHIPIHISGGAGSGSNESLDNYITTTQFSGAIVFNSSTALTDNGAGSHQFNAQLMAMQPSAYMGVDFSTSGVSIWMLSSFVGYVEQTFACSTGSWNCFQFKYNGSTLTSRLNGGGWHSPSSVVSGFNGTSLSTQSWRFGTPPYSSQNATADIGEGFLSKSLISDADFDNYLGAMRTKYGQPF